MQLFDVMSHSNTPVLIFEVLVQLKLVVDGARSPNKLLVLPGIGHSDAIGPHAEERDGTCSDGETRTQVKTGVKGC